MLTILLLISLIAVAVAIFYQRRKLALSILTVILITLMLVCFGPLAYIALSGLQTRAHLTSPQWKADNLIVVLGFGVVKWNDKVEPSSLSASRILEAARLYVDCKKNSKRCRVLATGGDPQSRGLSEAEAMAQELEGLGIPSLDILTETKSRNTFQNARFSRELLGQSVPDQIVVVTSGPHMRRAKVCFSHFFPNVVAAPADFIEVRMTARPYAQNIFYVDFAIHEYMGLILHRAYNLLGLLPAQESVNSR